MNYPVEKNHAPQTPHDSTDTDNGVQKTLDDAVKEPLIPVPMIDEINPPLEATLGGDDVVIPTEKEDDTY